MNRGRVLFYVQHLLGVGHLRRAATLARGLAAAGFDVHLASGGMPAEQLRLGSCRLIQLPPVKAANDSFRQLVDEHGRDVDQSWRDRRRAALLAAWTAVQPQVLIIELFPFGRWMMRFELVALLEAAAAARDRPLILCSLRDVLVKRDDAARRAATVDFVRRYFDYVLVHGDAAFLPLEQSFPEAPTLGDKLRYTGYIVDDAPAETTPDGPGKDEIIVSAGGGAVGRTLFETAMAARPLTRLKAKRWRILHGAGNGAGRLAPAAAPAGVVVEPARPDFPALLAHCRLSVSQGGYNTVMDVLRARARAVIVPYSAGNETEQLDRAVALARHGLVHVVTEADLTPASLAAVVDLAAAAPPPPRLPFRTDGVETSARLVRQWAEAMPC